MFAESGFLHGTTLWTIWGGLGLFGFLGLLALCSPTMFSRLAQYGGRWVDTSSWLAALDKRYDIDSVLLRHSRWLGLAVLVSLSYLAWVVSRYLA